MIRIESSEEIEWAPAYRPPVTHARSYAEGTGGSRYIYEEGEIAFGILVLEVLAIGVVGGVAFVFSSEPD